MLRDISIGFRGFTRALGFAFSNGLWWLFLLPLLFYLAFAAGMVWFSAYAVDAVGSHVAHYLAIDIPVEHRSGWPGLWDDLRAFINTSRAVVVAVVLRVALWFLFGLIGKYIVLIVLSPVMAYASERTEEILTGHRFPFKFVRFAKDVARGVLMALRNGLLELSINVAVWALTLFFAPVAPLSALFLWLVSCWFYGFSMFDYHFERKRLSIGASARFARGRSGMVLANGALFSLLLRIPLIGVMFAPLLASIGAVLAWREGEPTTASATST